MTNAMTEARSVIVERDLAFPPEKVWRALTQPHLIEAWLMKNDFALEQGHRFTFGGDWGSVDCVVREIAPNRTLSYTWDAFGLQSIVTWTLTPTGVGTRLRMEQAGFQPDQQQFFEGAEASWPEFLSAMDRLLARID